MAAAASEPSAGSAASFNRHGPFYRLQLRLGLLDARHLAVGKRAVLWAALAWLPAVAMAFAQGLALNPKHELALLLDFGVYAMVVSIIAFVLMEQTSDRRMAYLVRQFDSHSLLDVSAAAQVRQHHATMERRTGSAWVEGLLLLAAYLLSYRWLSAGAAAVEGGRWLGQVTPSGLQPSWAGWWAMLVLVPLFLFLLGRWCWRFVTWGLFLRGLAGCRLRLVATHPDHCGGLAFIGQYPSTYLLFVFALSTVVSAAVLEHIVHRGASLASFKFAAVAVLLFLVLAFVAPLTAFAPVLRKLKRGGLATYGALIAQHHRAFEQRWCGVDAPASAELLGSPDASSLADISAAYDLVKQIKPVPLTREGLLPLLFAALLPMVIVAATQMPFKVILDTLRKVLPF